MAKYGTGPKEITQHMEIKMETGYDNPTTEGKSTHELLDFKLLAALCKTLQNTSSNLFLTGL